MTTESTRTLTERLRLVDEVQERLLVRRDDAERAYADQFEAELVALLQRTDTEAAARALAAEAALIAMKGAEHE